MVVKIHDLRRDILLRGSFQGCRGFGIFNMEIYWDFICIYGIFLGFNLPLDTFCMAQVRDLGFSVSL